MHLFYQPESVTYLTPDDSHHAVKTLRLNPGDPIAVTDGHGNRFLAVIAKADARQCTFRVTDRQTTPKRPFSIRLCVAPTKNMDRIEWLVEKAVELGIERISFFVSQHSERRVLKTDRIVKIAVAAMKQSLQNWLPVIDEAVPFVTLVADVDAADVDAAKVAATDAAIDTKVTVDVDRQQRFVAHLPVGAVPVHLFRAAVPGRSYTVLIGPEGDFSQNELTQAIAAGFQMVTLGPNRLRTETAALVASQILTLVNV